MQEKRELIKLVLSNLELDDEKIVWIAQKPFDLILENVDSKLWQPLVDRFRAGNVDTTIGLSHIQTVFSEFGLKTKFT